MGAFEGLLEQIDAFIKKYYKNQILRGLLLFVLIFLGAFLMVTLLEYFGRFNSIVRAILFFSFIILNVFVLAKYFIIPVTKLFSFGKRISRKQAATIIGSFFPDIKDRLLNTLQLNQDSESNIGNIELLRASVSQRAKTLSAIPFTKAIDYKENRGYLKFLLPLSGLIVLLAFFLPNAFTESTTRLVNYNEKFVLPAPFDFHLKTESLNVEEGESLTLDLEIVPKAGEMLPAKVYAKTARGLFLMKKEAKNRFVYTIEKLDNSQQIYFKSNGFESKRYLISVVGKTVVSKLEATLNYPAYLEMEDKVVQNVGDLIVPEGTNIEWSVRTENTKQVKVEFGNVTKLFNKAGFNFAFKAKEATKVKLNLENKYLDKLDSLQFNIDVLKDAYPTINVSQDVDSITKGRRVFSGIAEDDKGLRSISFVYVITDKNGDSKTEAQSVPGVRGAKCSVNMVFDISTLPLQSEDKVSFYFVVYDNDAVNGYKSAKSSVFSYRAPSKDEVKQNREESTNAAKSSLSELMKRSESFKKDLNTLRKELFENKNSDWNQVQQLENLKKEQLSLQKEIEKVKKELENSMSEIEKFNEVNEELAEKQKLIEELMENMMDDEMLKLLEKLEELMSAEEQESIRELMDEMELSTEEMNNNLDRTLEQLKKMQVNESLEDLQDKLEELAKKQEELSQRLEDKELSKEDALSQQQELEEEFKKAEKELEDVLKDNEELDRPMDLDDLKSDREQVKENQSESKENIEKGKSEKGSDAGKKAAKKMKEMAAKLGAMQEQSKEKQAKEDVETLRGILENLMQLSFNQEENMNDFSKVEITDPFFVELGRLQRKVMDDTKPVEDSLLALAKRVPKIASFIDKELNIVKSNFVLIPDDIDERRARALGVKQQYVMTSLNNLSLFLNETLQDMQNEMQSDQPGSGSCDNPGSGSKGNKGKSMEGMKEMLKKQLESLEKGMSPGGKKPSGEGGTPMPFGSKQAAQMAAQQNAMREKLNQMKNDLNKDGEGKGNVLNELLKELEDQERDLINKEWNSDLINRQKDILTRLLESEKAIEERGFDDKRESKEGKNQENSNQIQFIEYNKLKAQQIELLRSVSPDFDRYYKDRASEYFNRVN
ncbi:MAG: hypothetical protein ACPGU5_08265 [Lishizhenia sp.]